MTLYHLSPQSNRESIAAYGLEPSETLTPSAVWFFETREGAELLRDRGWLSPTDLWEAEMSAEEIDYDPRPSFAPCWEGTGRTWITRSRVEPERLRLL